METSLHRSLKEHYLKRGGQLEFVLGNYRIDVKNPKQLVEVQHGSLAAIRDKAVALTDDGHRLLIVKPIIARKRLISLDKKDGTEVSRRYSPARGTLLDVFDELIYFTRVFPRKGLTLEVALVEIEELRYPRVKSKTRRRRGRFQKDFQVADQQLVHVNTSHRLRFLKDLWHLLPDSLPKDFHTGHLAEAMSIPRHRAQRIAYCLREMGAVDAVGKQGRAWLYRRRRTRKRTKAA